MSVAREEVPADTPEGKAESNSSIDVCLPVGCLVVGEVVRLVLMAQITGPSDNERVRSSRLCEGIDEIPAYTGEIRLVAVASS